MRRHIISVMACIAVILPAVVSCDHGRNIVEKFAEIDRICDTDQKRAMSMLDSIDYGSLSEKQRHRYDFLQIKTRDKAYIKHTTDSLVIDVIDYYSKHREEGLYPEALYYGGRVYSDMGDFPTSIGYFQDALDVIPDDKKNLRLKCRTLSQTGRLLAKLRVHTQAIEYIEKSINLSKQQNDSLNIAYDCILLSEIFQNINNLKSAKNYILDALEHSNSLPICDKAWINVEYAGILNREGKTDSAINIIRPLPRLVDSQCYYYTLCNAAKIYLNAGIIDSAYMYAKELAFCNSFEYQKNGFSILFSPVLRTHMSSDSIVSYSKQWADIVEKYFNTYDSQQTILQNANYNYKSHVREKDQAKKELHNLGIFTAYAITVLLTCLVILLYKKYKATIEKFRIAEVIRIFQQQVTVDPGHVNEDEIYNNSEKLLELKRKYFDAIQLNFEDNPEKMIHPMIKGSQLYKDLVKKAQERNCIIETENTWSRLETLIESATPGFHTKLKILTEGKISEAEIKVAILMRCGFTPTKIGILLSRERNTISSHRISIAEKISADKSVMKQLDHIILTL